MIIYHSFNVISEADNTTFSYAQHASLDSTAKQLSLLWQLTALHQSMPICEYIITPGDQWKAIFTLAFPDTPIPELDHSLRTLQPTVDQSTRPDTAPSHLIDSDPGQKTENQMPDLGFDFIDMLPTTEPSFLPTNFPLDSAQLSDPARLQTVNFPAGQAESSSPRCLWRELHDYEAKARTFCAARTASRSLTWSSLADQQPRLSTRGTVVQNGQRHSTCNHEIGITVHHVSCATALEHWNWIHACYKISKTGWVNKTIVAY
ncbi:hypothetical protein AC578_1188 [Pseudocercospora eumusae]|uniref:Uncharacterized protein n=1 Tax=Pseudocercospora eumusae TaxID=321146 RepID=A0A139H076_9PEZI|nr:hypothetical protein AC578_1188 [Pseudocercospora eumusae]KXS95823.1 hypothetical protein AC578_1188 [Pseudocercospora eumusae]